MSPGSLYDIDEGAKIVGVILDRLSHRLADSLESREMDYRVNSVVGEQLVHGGSIAEVHLHERDVFPSGDFLHAFKAGHVAVGHVVRHHYVVSRLDELHCHVAPDKPGTSGN